MDRTTFFSELRSALPQSLRRFSLALFALVVISPLPVAGHDFNFLDSMQYPGTGAFRGQHVVVDGQDNVIVVGSFQGTVNFGGGPLVSAGDWDIFLAKLDASGSHLWSRRFGNTGADEPADVSVDAAGNISIGGTFRGAVDFGGGSFPGGPISGFVASYTPTGAHQWSRAFADGSVLGLTTAAGAVVIGGAYNEAANVAGDPPSVGYVTVAAFNADGTYRWVHRHPAGIYSGEQGGPVAVDGNGNVYATIDSWYFGPDTDYDHALLTKLDWTGQQLWQIGVGSGQHNFATDVANWPAGGVIVVGNGTNGYILNISPAGGQVWSKSFPSPSPAFRSVVVNANSDILVLGEINGSANLGGGPIFQQVADLFLARFLSDGSYDGSQGIPNSGTAHAGGIALDGSGNVLVTGNFTGAIEFDDILTTSGTDVFLARAVDSDASPTAAGELPVTSLLLPNYPNPFNPSTTIRYQSSSAHVELRVYDVSGAVVRTLVDDVKAAGAYAQNWDGRDDHGVAVSSGVYFYRITTGKFSSVRKMTLVK